MATALPISVSIDDPHKPDITALLSEHLADMFAISPAESVHALDVDALTASSITFWTARDSGNSLLGCAALKQHDKAFGELKSMRTATAARGRGVASVLLGQVLAECRARGLSSIKLETGTEDYFAAARRLYERHGFTVCAPFADYQADPNSAYYELVL